MAQGGSAANPVPWHASVLVVLWRENCFNCNKQAKHGSRLTKRPCRTACDTLSSTRELLKSAVCTYRDVVFIPYRSSLFTNLRNGVRSLICIPAIVGSCVCLGNGVAP